jgi:hypothetical protein
MRPRTKDQHLPKCVYFRHGAHYLVKSGKWTRIDSLDDYIKTGAISNPNYGLRFQRSSPEEARLNLPPEPSYEGMNQKQARRAHLTWKHKCALARSMARVEAGAAHFEDVVDLWAGLLYSRSKMRAKKSGIEFSITKQDVIGVAKRSQWHCEVTRIPFDTTRKHQVKSKRPFVPSLDRIDSNKGYTPENIRLVCFAVNAAMGAWGEEILKQIALSYVASNDL